jgi:hypothetical protein
VTEDVSKRVLEELEANGYEPRLHPPSDPSGTFTISLPSHGFGLGDLRTMVRISEDAGVGLKMDDRGRITLS